MAIRTNKKIVRKKSKKVYGRKPHRSFEKVFRTDSPPFKEVHVVDDFTSGSFRQTKR